MPLRLIFMGTPDFAVPTLLELVAHGHEIVAVYTRAPKPAGRGMKLQPTPVEQEARRLGIPVLTPTTLKTPEALEEFRAHNADAAVVVAYGMILPQAILDAPPLGCFNLHASLLPRWRGAAPINRAIMAGDAESGVMVMKMDIGLDTGDVAMAERLAITDTMTAADLHDALAPLGADLMVRAMGALARGGLQLQQAERGRRDLRRQDRQGRGADRLAAPGARGAAAYSRPVAVPRRLVRDRQRRRTGAHQDSALRTGEWLRRARRGARRPPDHCLRRRRDPDSRTAARRQTADEGRRIPARHAAQAAGAARLMPRYKLIIEYDGTPFSGWQIQDNAPTVQGAMETAVKAICGEHVRVHGSGRTDAGVHALAQVAHCDIEKPFPPGRLRDGLNAHLRPHPIGVLSAEIVADDFEARFSAKRRHYRYRITNHRANLALDIKRSWRVPRHLDTDAMHVAAQRLLGKHDFTTFRDTECQAKSPEKTLDQLDVVREGDAVSILTSARSFLHSQVRSMVGSLVWVGEGRWSADDLAAALAARNRAACGPVAPPDGLYLVRVEY